MGGGETILANPLPGAAPAARLLAALVWALAGDVRGARLDPLTPAFQLPGHPLPMMQQPPAVDDGLPAHLAELGADQADDDDVGASRPPQLIGDTDNVTLTQAIREAHDRMAAHWLAVEDAEARGETGNRGAWKWGVRLAVWDAMEEASTSVLLPPRPVHQRVPSFIGDRAAAQQVELLPEFHSANVIQVGSEALYVGLRQAALKAGKTLVVPSPRMARDRAFTVVDPAAMAVEDHARSVSINGILRNGRPLDLRSEQIKVDLLVVGAVAVDPNTGARLGVGDGFTDLGYALLRQLGVVNDATPVVTTVHDMQLWDLPSEAMARYDVPVDIICAPSGIFRVPRTLPRPTGLFWDLISPQRLGRTWVLRELKAQLEAEGFEMPIGPGPSEVLPPPRPGPAMKGQVNLKKARRRGMRGKGGGAGFAAGSQAPPGRGRGGGRGGRGAGRPPSGRFARGGGGRGRGGGRGGRGRDVSAAVLEPMSEEAWPALPQSSDRAEQA